jgi:hypothetical protein
VTNSDPQRDEDEHDREPPRRSASAEAGALRWQETHPVDPDALPVESDLPPETPRPEGWHSASAEAAALRWEEEHADDEEA